MKLIIGKILFCLTFLAIILVAILSDSPNSFATEKVSALNPMINFIEVHNVDKFITKHPNLLIIDIRSVDEYNTGHLPKSINIPIGIFDEQMIELKENMTHPILVYCQLGKRSITVAEKLRQKGFTDVYVLKDGISAYDGTLEKNE